MECLEPKRRLSGNVMENIMECLESERRLSGNILVIFNEMSGAQAVFERKLKGHLMDGNYIN